jgi:hypothetical protein
MSPFGTKCEFSPDLLKARNPPHYRRSGMYVVLS